MLGGWFILGLILTNSTSVLIPAGTRSKHRGVKWNFNETEIKIDFWRKALLLVLMDYSCRAGWCKKTETRVNAEKLFG